MRIGLDFGTTNSGAAVFDGGQVHVLPLERSAEPSPPASRLSSTQASRLSSTQASRQSSISHDPAVIRSTMYITRDHQISIGREAVESYYHQNVGRPSKLVRQYVGEIEVTAADMSFIRDVYVLVDELTPGRLLRSLKSGLATSYEGTTIFGRYYELEDLIALYLRQIRQRVEAETGQAAEGVVLGRPVNFAGSTSPADNQRAVDRLRRAAEKAGFREVTFELEPVAAALHYEMTISQPQNIVVFDFGGGTLDITVMRVGEPGRERRRKDRQVFATGGVGIAGDVFDQRVIEVLLLDHFGRGSTWGENATPFPSQYTDALINWQAVPELNRPETLHFLQLVQISGSHPARIKALESLLVNNYAVHLFDEVERAKIDLSTDYFALIRLAEEEIDVWQPLTRSQFESLIAGEARRIEACLLDTLHRSGMQPDDIDAVVRTGGSAQIPSFVDMLGRIFGPDKVVLSDVFSGVTAGLAVRAGTYQ